MSVTETTGPFSFSAGPNHNTRCCGKPVGCNMTHDGCSYLNHRWKLANVPGHRERMAQRRADGQPRELVCLHCEAVIENTDSAISEHRDACSPVEAGR